MKQSRETLKALCTTFLMTLSICIVVMNESLRLNPPLAEFNRECVDDNKFNDIYIFAGLQLIILVYFLHSDSDV